MAPIKYCNIAGGNFGDDLNLQLWERLFPDLRSLNGKAVFYGVGTLLDGHHDPRIRKVVLGTGIGELHAAVPDSNWDFRWVRGPKTAGEFGLPQQLALGDSSILWPGLHEGHDPLGPVGLIPHYATWDSFDWNRVAELAGMWAINPRQSPCAVIEQMHRCSRVLSESLHGAIFADAMSIPWATGVLAHRFNEFKWRDWLATIDRRYSPLVLDRPLVRSLACSKALANRLARLVRYQRLTRHPALRPVSVATGRDVLSVAGQLRDFANEPGHFTCSAPYSVKQQKARMQQACEQFAHDYQLDFTP